MKPKANIKAVLMYESLIPKRKRNMEDFKRFLYVYRDYQMMKGFKYDFSNLMEQ